MKVTTEAIQFRADIKLISYIEEKLAKLDRFFDRILQADVTLRLENSGQVKDKITEIRLQLPGETLVASSSHKSFEAAASDVVDMLARQLKKHKEKIVQRARK
ncbi:MAG: ribosome-associated translation inhibitor RaiA [Bacteroidota bacterium]